MKITKKNLFERKNNVWLFVGVLVACFAVSTGVRYQQFETWKLTPQTYFVGERPMMTTLDAPYYLRWAREYNEGVYGQKSGLRGYPESTETFQENSVPEKYIDLPVNITSGRNKGTPPTLSFPSPEALVIRYRDVSLLSF